MRALITGATSGIGKDMAVYLSSMGWDLILTGRNEDMLKKMERKLSKRVDVKIVPLDLSESDAPYYLYRKCKDINVDMLVNNAGYGVFGEFTETKLKDEMNMVDLNVKALHILTKLFLRDFVKRDGGTILNVASSAGFLPGPLFSSYYASKSYVVNLSLAIHEELRKRKSNVRIGVLCPGPVDTNFNSRANVSFGVKAATSHYVAKYAIDSVLNGRFLIIPTLKMKIGIYAARFAPFTLLLKVAYKLQSGKIN